MVDKKREKLVREMIRALPQRVEQHMQQNPDYARRVTYARQVSKPILEDLAKAGYEIQTLAELRHLGKPWKAALPILQHWLRIVDELGVKEDIVRGLSVPWIGNTATAVLIGEFKRYAPILRQPTNPWVGNQLKETPEEEKKLFPAYSLAWAIGNALSIVSVEGFEKEVIQLALDSRYGQARQMIVLGLGRLRSWDAQEAAVELLNDEDVKLHAIIALGTMKSKRALFELERLLTDKRAVVRKEARKAITKINR